MKTLQVFKNSTLSEVKGLRRQEATPAQKDLAKDIIRYGENDNFPLRLARLIQQSPTASSCIDTKIDFIQGGGFSDDALKSLPIGSNGLKFNDLHAHCSDSYGTFEGFAYQILWNLKGNITEIRTVPFEYCRLGIPDKNGNINKIHVNPYYGTGEYNIRYTKEYDVYNPKLVARQQEEQGTKYKGQIYWFGTTGPMSRFYPVPKFYSCHSWMAIDEAIGGFHEHNIENGFFQSVLFRMIGDPMQPSEHPDDMVWNATSNQYEPNPKLTQAYRLNIEMQKFSGWDKAGNVMVQWGASKEELPDIVDFPSTTNAELFKTLSDLTTENIARGTKVPAILANIQSGASLGGDGNNIRASVKLMQQRVVKIHSLLIPIYQELLSHLEKPYTAPINILHYNPFPEADYKSVDVNIWNALTMPEKRNWIKKNTNYDILDENPDIIMPDHPPIPVSKPVVQSTQPATAIQNKFEGIFFKDYPQSAKDSATKALNFKNSTNSSCGGKAGWQMCEDIIGGRPISYREIRRIYNYLKKNRNFANNVFSDSCEAVLFSAWGGVSMFDWCESKINSINE